MFKVSRHTHKQQSCGTKGWIPGLVSTLCSTEARASQAAASVSLIVGQNAGAGAFLAGLATIAFGIVATIFLFRRARRLSAARELGWSDQVRGLDALRATDPDAAQKGYRKLIGEIEKRAAKRPLGASGVEALGRAYQGDSAVLFLKRERASAERQLRTAATHLRVDGDGWTILLARSYADADDTSDEAVQAWVNVLQLPADRVDAALKEKIASLLEKLEHSWVSQIPGLDALRAKNPGAAQQGYRKLIQAIEKHAAKCSLGPRGKEALGRAFLGDCTVLLFKKDRPAAERQLRAAAKHVHVEQGEWTVLLTRSYADAGDTSDEAVHAWLDFLGLPAERADAVLKEKVIGLLERCCRIDASTPPNRRDLLLGINSQLAVLPTESVRILVESDEGPGQGYSIVKTTDIGRDPASAIALTSPSVSRHHARVMAQGEFWVVADIGSKTGTFVNGERIEAPRVLKDSDRIGCGRAVLRFYSKARILDRDLTWCHRNLGIGYSLREEYSRSEHELLRVLSLNPNDADAEFYLGRAQHGQKAFQAAFDAYARAIELRSDYAEAYYWWGRGLIDQAEASGMPPSSEIWQTRIPDAIARFRQAINLDQKRGEYRHALARAYELAEEPQQAVEAMKTAVEVEGSNLNYRLKLMRLARSQRRDDLARSQAVAVLSLDTANQEAVLLLGNLAFEQEDYAAAAERYDQLRAMEINAGTQKYTNAPAFAWRLGRSLFETGKYDAASRALAALPESRVAMLFDARCRSSLGQFEEAAKILMTLLERFGDVAEARFYLASCLANLGRLEEALEQAERVATVAQWSARGLCMAARLLTLLGRWDEAAERLSRAQVQATRVEEVRFEQGRLSCVRGNYAEAAQAFEAALSSVPYEPRYHLWLGLARFGLSEHDQADRHFKRAVEGAGYGGILPEERQAVAGEAAYHLGRLARAQGRHEEAAEYLKAARRNGCAAAQLAVELASSYAESGRYADALTEYSALSVKNPSDRTVVFNTAAISCRIAREHLEQGRHEDAVILFEQSLEHFTRIQAEQEAAEVADALAEAHFRVGSKWVGSSNGQVQSGIASLERARSLRGDPRCSYMLGAAYFKTGEFERALACFEAAVSQEASLAGLKGLALSLEKSGKVQEAEAAWDRCLAATTDGASEQVEILLGKAGLQVRTGQWQRAAAVLQEVLALPAAANHRAYPDLCKLAVSYLSLSGAHEAAEQLIRKHLSGKADEVAGAYLAAVLSQQDRLDEALKHLQSVVSQKKATPDVLDLLEAICRTLAARKVMAGDLAGAMEMLTGARKARGKLMAESESLLGSINACLFGKNLGAELTDKNVAAYENALKKAPKNPTLRRNCAIVNHQLAIQLEKQQKYGHSDTYWKRAIELWLEIIGDKHFWNVYAQSFEQGGNRLDRICPEDAAAIAKHVQETLTHLHVELVKEYAAEGVIQRVEAHLGYVLRFRQDQPFRNELASSTLERAGLGRDGEDIRNICNLADVLDRLLRPEGDGLRNLSFNLWTHKAVEALWNKQVDEFKSAIGEAATRFRGTSDFRKMARAAAQTDNSFISEVIDQAKVIIAILSRASPDDEKKASLLGVVLQLCSVWDSVPSYRRSDLNVTEIITRVLMHRSD